MARIWLTGMLVLPSSSDCWHNRLDSYCQRQLNSSSRRSSSRTCPAPVRGPCVSQWHPRLSSFMPPEAELAERSLPLLSMRARVWETKSNLCRTILGTSLQICNFGWMRPLRRGMRKGSGRALAGRFDSDGKRKRRTARRIR